MSRLVHMAANLLQQRWTAERIRAWQSSALRETVAHACAKVPFYTRHFAASDVRPEDIRSIEDLHRISIVQRLEYRRAPEADRIAAGTDTTRTLKVKTSGSTGIPLEMHFTHTERKRFSAIWDLARLRWGFWPWRSRLSIGVNRRTRVAPNHDILAVNSDYSLAFDKHHDILAAYPSILLHLANEARRLGKTVRPRIVYSGGETLTPAARAFLEETFRAPVLDFFGAVEFGIVLEPCRARHGFRVMAPDWIVEVLRPDGTTAAPGEEGELVITQLGARVMPFLRYAIGDHAIAGPTTCSCSAYAHIACVHGRETQPVFKADGTELPPMTISVPFYERTDLLHYRVTQRTLTSFLIEIVPAPTADVPSIAAEVRAYYAKRYDATDIEIQNLSAIPPEPNGKIRRFIPLAR